MSNDPKESSAVDRALVEVKAAHAKFEAAREAASTARQNLKGLEAAERYAHDAYCAANEGLLLAAIDSDPAP